MLPGRYTDELEAAKAYDAAAYYLYGESAITNFGLDTCRGQDIEVGTPCVGAIASNIYC
jgi:hypothetical protein